MGHDLTSVRLAGGLDVEDDGKHHAILESPNH